MEPAVPRRRAPDAPKEDARDRATGIGRSIVGPAILSALTFGYSILACAGAGREAVFWGFLLLVAGIPLFVLARWRTGAASARLRFVLDWPHFETGATVKNRPTAVGSWILTVVLTTGAALADLNMCDEPGEHPDLVIGDMTSITRWGSIGGVTSFSSSTSVCNFGTCWALYAQYAPGHPVVIQNAYRLNGGRFEQLGQSWAFHPFWAHSLNQCETDCHQTNGSRLGVNCVRLPWFRGLPI